MKGDMVPYESHIVVEYACTCYNLNLHNFVFRAQHDILTDHFVLDSFVSPFWTTLQITLS